MTTPHQSHCELCTWSSDPFLDRDTAGCYATWHVYEEHRSMWQLIFGSEPPRDPDAMGCPEGFCRDAKHCIQGSRCEDAIGELTPLVNRAIPLEEQIAFLRGWAADNRSYFEDEGEVGIGRECVGIISGDHYPSYREYDSNYDEIHHCAAADPPEDVEDAYHKADVLAVLGRGPRAINQLYLWVRHLADKDIVIGRIPRSPTNSFDAILHGFDIRILVERNAAGDRR